jgi:hypothetical protein
MNFLHFFFQKIISVSVLSAPINFWSMTEICLNFILDSVFIGKAEVHNIYGAPYIAKLCTL